jgi:hypothetical protein
VHHHAWPPYGRLRPLEMWTSILSKKSPNTHVTAHS